MADAKDEGATEVDPLLKAVADRIEKLWKAKGWSPADFARAAHVTLPYLSRLRAGGMNLTLRSISRMAIALDVEMSRLLEDIPADPATLPTREWKPKPKPKLKSKPRPRLKSEPERGSDGEGARDGDHAPVD